MSAGSESGVAASQRPPVAPAVHYVLRYADTCLVHAQRLGEWCGHAPVLEEDIALANLALDLLGQARSLLTRAGEIEGHGRDENRLAYWRDEHEFFNLTLAELPLRRPSGQAAGGDFADTVVRNLLLSCWLHEAWRGLQSSCDDDLAAIAAKAVKESRYHREHAAGWVVRLGDGSDESHRRMAAALDRAWPYTAEMFARDTVEAVAEAGGLGPARDTLRTAWLAAVRPVLAEATLAMPEETPFVSTGSAGVHSEHLGYLLAEMQVLQRRHPGGRW